MQGRARVKRTMWTRRAQEYEAKINSGDLISIAEVVRDLYRSDNQPEQSYSERQLYEAALDRMSREIAAVNKMSETEAVRQIEDNLAKGPRRGAKADNEESRAGRGCLSAARFRVRALNSNPALSAGFFFGGDRVARRVSAAPISEPRRVPRRCNICRDVQR